MRVTRTFAFLDLTGFTAMTEARGDRHAVAVLGVFRAALRDICSRRGVRIAKWLGDGAMLVCVETGPLVATTLEMQCAIDAAPENITIKCGITKGQVILLEGDDYIGHSVNLASRLCDLAEAHEVLGLTTIAPDLPLWAKVDHAGEMAVSGLERPVEVVRLGLMSATDGCVPDPVCRIPLTESTAMERRYDGDGRILLFCSSSCCEAWEQELSAQDHDFGSVRELWMR